MDIGFSLRLPSLLERGAYRRMFAEKDQPESLFAKN